LKEKVEKTTKNIAVFQIVERDQMEQRMLSFFCDSRAAQKNAIGHGLVAVLQGNTVSYSRVTIFHSAGRLFWARIRKRPHQPS
jgi:hypothetical protein